MMRHIELWYDETSDSDNPVYCVSLCEPDGEEIMCLSTHDDKTEATEAAERSATKRGLALIER